jgi:hypothetical protein
VPSAPSPCRSRGRRSRRSLSGTRSTWTRRGGQLGAPDPWSAYARTRQSVTAARLKKARAL